MSTELATLHNTGKKMDADLQITQFCGPLDLAVQGMDRRMIQLTQGFGSTVGPDEPGFIVLTKRDALWLAAFLLQWGTEK